MYVFIYTGDSDNVVRMYDIGNPSSNSGKQVDDEF